MTTMREKIARTIYIRQHYGHPLLPWEKVEPPVRAVFLGDADAVLDAMRGDPGHDITEAVVEPTRDRTWAVEAWDKMIAKAKEER